MKILFHLHYSVIRMGSHGSLVLCTASSRCKRIAVPGRNETTDCVGHTHAFVHAHLIDLFILCKVKTGTAMAGLAVVAPHLY